MENLAKIRGLRKIRAGDIRGGLTSNEEDLLRAAIVFTGAGLDAALKRLIRDTLPPLLQVNTQANEKFEVFLPTDSAQEESPIHAPSLAT